MLASQEGRCAICPRELTLVKAHTDHNHVTGRVRGLLCNSCNVALGLLDEDVERFIAAINYLKEP